MKLCISFLTFGNNPSTLPMEQTDLPSSWGEEDRIIRQCEFDPEDEELCISVLTKDWEGYEAYRTYIVHGLTVTGHPLALVYPAPQQ